MGTTHFQWSSVTDNVVEEFDDLGATQVSNTHLPEEFGELVAQHDTETHFHHYDDRGSTAAITDDAGNVGDEFEYNAYGEEVAHTGASETPYRFQGAYGYYTDTDLGSIYIRRRTYEPQTGRWLSKDPIGFVDGDNLYKAYFVTGSSDPMGLYCQEEECCVQSLISLRKGPNELVGGFNLNDYLHENKTWGNRLRNPEETGPDLHGYKVQFVAQFTGKEGNCGYQQWIKVEEANDAVLKGLSKSFGFEIQKGKLYYDLSFGADVFNQEGLKLKYSPPYMTAVDAPRVNTHSKGKYLFETCFYSNSSNCVFQRCCIDWEWSFDFVSFAEFSEMRILYRKCE